MPREVTCPICLSHLDWDDMKPFRWDKTRRVYEELAEADLAGLSPEQENLLMQTVSWRCPNLGAMGMHFLPDAYGKHGKPVVLGFVGNSRSGKTHLLAAMIGEIERGELARGALARYGLSWRPVDQYRHQVFLEENVRKLLDRSQVLTDTPEQIVSFADALLISQGAGEPRPVALFDVAGDELKDATNAKRFLEIADGFIFVVDPDNFGNGNRVDPTFAAVLSLLSGRLGSVSAAVVLNKADQCRFDDPVALWLRRSPDPFDQDAIREESADVYAYLHRRNASASARPFRECGRATLHVASATGGRKGEGADDGRYPRGVHPQRVLAPLLSLLVMTGLLDQSKSGA